VHNQRQGEILQRAEIKNKNLVQNHQIYLLSDFPTAPHLSNGQNRGERKARNVGDPSFRFHLSYSSVNPGISSHALLELFNPFGSSLVRFRITPFYIFANSISLDSSEVVDCIRDRVEELAIDHLALDSCAHLFRAVFRPVPECSWRNRSKVDIWARQKLIT